MNLLDVMLELLLLPIVLRAWESSRVAIGTVWGIIDGHLQGFRSVLDNTVERVIILRCDMVMCFDERLMLQFVLSMFWRVLESMTFIYERLGFQCVFIPWLSTLC